MTSGIALARGYYREVVAPLLYARWPRLPHAAILYRAQRDAGLPAAEGLPTEPHIARPIFGVRAAVVDPLLDAITDPQLRAVPAGTGSLEQWLQDHVRILMDAPRRVDIARSYLSIVAPPSARPRDRPERFVNPST